jgi:hypothetical protein
MKTIYLKVEVPDNTFPPDYKIIDEIRRAFPSVAITEIHLPTPEDIRDEMDGDMEESGMAQGEIESCLTHWGNKYIIVRKPATDENTKGN